MASAAKAFGGSDYGDEPEAEDDMGEEKSEYPPEYEQAYQEYEDAPSMETFWRAVEACTAASKGGPALLIGVGKPKKT